MSESASKPTCPICETELGHSVQCHKMALAHIAKLEALGEAEQKTIAALRTQLEAERQKFNTDFVRCHQCGGTVIFKWLDDKSGIEFFHSCWSKEQRAMTAQNQALRDALTPFARAWDEQINPLKVHFMDASKALAQAPDATGDRASDTQRLDWIIAGSGRFGVREGKNGAVVWNQSDGLTIAGRGKTAREAIDAAMNSTPGQERKEEL